MKQEEVKSDKFIESNKKSITVLRIGPKPKDPDSILLNDAFEFIKLNYNCPDSEKVGSGPGSCSGGNSNKITDTDIDRGKYYGFKNIVEITSETVLNHRRSIQQKMEDDVTNLTEKFPNEVASLKSYPAKYKTINNDIDNKLPETNDIIKLIDSNTIPENIVVYKGIDNKIITDLSKHDIGDIIKLGNGFVSTSLYQDIAESYAIRREPNNRSFIEIHIPKGTNGIYLESLQQDSSPGYHEVLLQKNSDYKLLSKEIYQPHAMALRYTKYIVEAIPKRIKQNSRHLSKFPEPRKI